MMNDSFLLDFKTVIRECNYENTYKMAWARALVELSTINKDIFEVVTIKLEQIAYMFLKYYWNQTIYFNLIQGSNINKAPTVVSYVKELIKHYYGLSKQNLPNFFEKIENTLDKKLVNLYIKKIISVLKKDVSWRFLILNNKQYTNLYSYEIGSNELYISLDNVNTLKDNERDLYDLINYRWALILESFNSSLRINKKVKILDDREIQRKPLNKFKQYLDLENPNKICFYCNKEIKDESISIDHVIPWIYLYSDDIWNLVYVCRSCNSIKSNKVPEAETINKLKIRNLVLKDKMLLKKKDKNFDELLLAIEKDYVTKFWTGCKY